MTIDGNIIKKNIAKNIVRCRERAGLTQKELAQKLNITPSRVSNWEQGANCPTIDILIEVCNLLKVSINDIYGVYPDVDMALSSAQVEHMQKYIFVEEHFPEGAEMINYLLEKEYKTAVKLKQMEERIKELEEGEMHAVDQIEETQDQEQDFEEAFYAQLDESITDISVRPNKEMGEALKRRIRQFEKRPKAQ